MKIRELLTDESKWTKHAKALNGEGNTTNPNSDTAICWCLIGAIEKCYKEGVLEWLKIHDKIHFEIGKPITAWNDAPERTFEEVKQLVEKLDI